MTEEIWQRHRRELEEEDLEAEEEEDPYQDEEGSERDIGKGKKAEAQDAV